MNGIHFIKDVCAKLNGANSMMLSRFTMKTAHEAASADTRTFGVVRWICARRLQWVRRAHYQDGPIPTSKQSLTICSGRVLPTFWVN